MYNYPSGRLCWDAGIDARLPCSIIVLALGSSHVKPRARDKGYGHEILFLSFFSGSMTVNGKAAIIP